MSQLILIPIALPILWGTVILIKKWKKKPWRKNRFILFNTCLSAAVTVGFLIASFSESFEADLAGPVSLALKIDGLGAMFAAIASALMLMSVCYLLEYMEDPRDAGKHEALPEEVPADAGRKKALLGLLNYLYAAALGISFSENAATAGGFLLLFALLLLVVRAVGNAGAGSSSETADAPGKNAASAGSIRKLLSRSVFPVCVAVVFLVFLVATFAGNGQVFSYNGFLSGSIGEAGLLILYVLAFCACGAPAAVRPFLQADKANKSDTKRVGEKENAAGKPDTDLYFSVTNLFADLAMAFLLLRLTFSCFGVSLLRGTWAQIIIILLSAAAVLCHSVLAVRRKDIEGRLSYIYAASFGLILAGTSVMTSHGYAAAVWELAAFAAIQTLLLFFLGAVYKKGGFPDAGAAGMAKKMPVTFGCYTVAAMGMCAVPPLAGFLAVWKIAKAGALQGGANYITMAAMFASLLLSALCMSPVILDAFFPKLEPARKAPIDEAGAGMLVPMVALAATVVFVGLFSGSLGTYIYEIALGVR